MIDSHDEFLLHELLDDRLDEAAALDVRARLEAEEELREAWDDYVRLRTTLRRETGPRAPHDFLSSVRRRIAADGPSSGDAASGDAASGDAATRVPPERSSLAEARARPEPNAAPASAGVRWRGVALAAAAMLVAAIGVRLVASTRTPEAEVLERAAAPADERREDRRAEGDPSAGASADDVPDALQDARRREGLVVGVGVAGGGAGTRSERARRDGNEKAGRPPGTTAGDTRPADTDPEATPVHAREAAPEPKAEARAEGGPEGRAEETKLGSQGRAGSGAPAPAPAPAAEAVAPVTPPASGPRFLGPGDAVAPGLREPSDAAPAPPPPPAPSPGPSGPVPPSGPSGSPAEPVAVAEPMPATPGGPAGPAGPVRPAPALATTPAPAAWGGAAVPGEPDAHFVLAAPDAEQAHARLAVLLYAISDAAPAAERASLRLALGAEPVRFVAPNEKRKGADEFRAADTFEFGRVRLTLSRDEAERLAGTTAPAKAREGVSRDRGGNDDDDDDDDVTRIEVVLVRAPR